jgi:hypothetical protein
VGWAKSCCCAFELRTVLTERKLPYQYFFTQAAIQFSHVDPRLTLSSHAGSDFNAMETEKALGDDPSGVYQALAIFSRG